MEKRRLVGVTVFGWILIGFGTIVLIAILITKIFISPEEQKELLRGISSNYFVFRAFVFMLIGYNLLKLNNWARLYVLINSWGYLFFVFSYIFYSKKDLSVLNEIFGLPISLKPNIFLWGSFSLIYILYFLKPLVKEQFNKDKNDVSWAIGLTVGLIILNYIMRLL